MGASPTTKRPKGTLRTCGRRIMHEMNSDSWSFHHCLSCASTIQLSVLKPESSRNLLQHCCMFSSHLRPGTPRLALPSRFREGSEEVYSVARTLWRHQAPRQGRTRPMSLWVSFVREASGMPCKPPRESHQALVPTWDVVELFQIFYPSGSSFQVLCPTLVCMFPKAEGSSAHL